MKKSEYISILELRLDLWFDVKFHGAEKVVMV